MEDFLNLPLRSLWLTAVFGLLAVVCSAQDPVPPRQAPPDQSSQDQASQNQPSRNQASQKPASQNQASPTQGQSQQGQVPEAPTPQGQAQQTQSGNNQAERTGSAREQESPSKAEEQDSSSKAPPAQEPADQTPPSQAPASKSSSSKPPRPPAQIQGTQVPITLESSETIFALLTALNMCGYDQDLTVSDAMRSTVRNEVQQVLLDSEAAEEARTEVCDFVQNHVAARDSNRNISQYISLALYMDGPPHFVPRVKEEDLPPDAYNVALFGKLLERFYATAGLHGIWERHRRDYAAAMQRYHDPLAKMVFDTQIYLKQPPSQYLGRKFTIYLDFMGSPNETDARNYAADYYVVVFPAPATNSGAMPPSALKMDQIRHTFLHYVLDPMADKHPLAMQRMEPLLLSVKRAPLEDTFKTDISLLVTECLIRAIEIHMSGGKLAVDETLRAQAVDDVVKQGYILTRYFYNAVGTFEKGDVSFKGVYGDLLDNLDVKKEQKAAAEVQFANVASPELVRLSRPEDRRLLITAEKRLAAGDPKGAQELAQEAVDKKIGDQGRALFILAEVAVATKNRDGAQENFQRAIAASADPIVLGWSHVYLGRILDMKEDRDAAVKEYRAALDTSRRLPDIKAAAERGLQQAYEPPAKPQ